MPADSVVGGQRLTGNGNAGKPVQPWQASEPGVAGIDTLHSFASDYEPAAVVPDTRLYDPTPEVGPWYQYRVPDGQPAAPYYAQRRASEAISTQYSETLTEGQDEPYRDMALVPDPRTATIPVERWTAKRGPMMFQFTRPFGQWQEAKFTGAHASMPVDARRGTRIANEQGFARYRTTQRVIPTPLEEQIASTSENQQQPTQVLQTGRGVRNWARAIHYSQ